MAALTATREKIISGALDLFLKQGIKKTSIEEVADQVGVTRITIYRYFADKKQLVEAAFLLIVTILEKARQEMETSPGQDIEPYLDQIIQQLSAFSKGDLPARMAELNRLYPDIHQDFHQARSAAIRAIFDHLIEAAARQWLLRENLNRQVVQAYFQSAVINVMQDPGLVSRDLPPAEIFATVKAIFLHGILKG